MDKVRKRIFYVTTSANRNSSISGVFTAGLRGIPLEEDA
jgi:hypothetical protein